AVYADLPIGEGSASTSTLRFWWMYVGLVGFCDSGHSCQRSFRIRLCRQCWSLLCFCSVSRGLLYSDIYAVPVLCRALDHADRGLCEYLYDISLGYYSSYTV